MHKVETPEAATSRAVLTHVMVDVYGVDRKTLNDPNQIGEILIGAAAAASLHSLAEPAAYRYPGQGLTIFLPIRESHFAIHTYPEHGYASTYRRTARRGPRRDRDTVPRISGGK
jgi:S-adenosylmethionine decarboxylase